MSLWRDAPKNHSIESDDEDDDYQDRSGTPLMTIKPTILSKRRSGMSKVTTGANNVENHVQPTSSTTENEHKSKKRFSSVSQSKICALM
jgi:hypothetical protein